MIIQTSNQPIEIQFTDNMEAVESIRVTLWNEKEELKTWTKEDLEINNNLIKAPLTQQETKAFPLVNATLEVKWLDEDGVTEFASQVKIPIVERLDKEVL